MDEIVQSGCLCRLRAGVGLLFPLFLPTFRGWHFGEKLLEPHTTACTCAVLPPEVNLHCLLLIEDTPPCAPWQGLGLLLQSVILELPVVLLPI